MSTLGVYVLADHLRCAEIGLSKSGRTLQIAFDAAHPESAVAALRAQLPGVRRIALSIGLAHLHVKHIKLPPAPAADRRRILALEPDRFFALQDERVAVALDAETNLAYAADAALLTRLIAAFEAWRPVDLVEPAPRSLARAANGTSGKYAAEAGPGESGVVEVEGGRVRAARRVIGAPPAALQSAGEFVVARGAALGIKAPVEEMLLPAAQATALRRRRATRRAGVAITAAALVTLLIFVADWSRERELERLTRETAEILPRAQGALELRDRLSAVERENAAVAELGRRKLDALPVLQALSERLPAGATLLSLTASADGWQIEGTANDAAAIVPLLDADDRFQDIRITSASTRFTDAGRTRETFAIAFRVRPAD